MAIAEWQPVDLTTDPLEFEYLGDPADMIDVIVFLAELRPAWQAEGACRVSPMGDISFFPGRGESARPAKDVCRGCAVRERCLNYALDAGSALSGIWGGTSDLERRRLRRTRTAAA